MHDMQTILSYKHMYNMRAGSQCLITYWLQSSMLAYPPAADVISKQTGSEVC